MNRMKKWLVGVVALSGLVLASCSNGEEVASTEAGRVYEDELYDRMKNEMTQSGMTYGEQMLQQILLEDILEDEYADAVSDEDIDEAFAAEAEAYGGVEEFEEILEMQGLSSDDLRDNLETTLYVQRAVEDHTDISEEEVEQAYEEYNVNSTVAHILVEEEELAQDIIDDLNDGADFGELVAEHSIDQGTVEADGQLPLEPGQFVPEFEEAAMELDEGEITQEPVESEFGYYVIEMVEVGEKGTLEEERDGIEDLLLQSYMQDPTVVQNAVGEIIREANVQIADDDLAGAMQAFLQEPVPEEELPEEGLPEELPEEGLPEEPAETEEDEEETTDEDTEESSEDEE